jgi:hypothetical protein
MKVQHWLDGGEETPDHEYETVACKACTPLHFINRRTRQAARANGRERALGFEADALSASEIMSPVDSAANAQRKHYRLRRLQKPARGSVRLGKVAPYLGSIFACANK